MKNIFFLLGLFSIFLLASCGKQDTTVPVGTAVPVVNYPTTQSETPATKFCTEHSGTISVEKNDAGVEIAYCTLPEGNKVDAWKFMSDGTSRTGTGM